MKKILKKLCVIIACVVACGGLNGCKPEPKITFSFTLLCSEDILNFVSPEASFEDENSTIQSVKLSKSDFSISENSVKVDNIEYVLYEWKKEIIIKSKAAQRDMKISYKFHENTPAVDLERTYVMIHQIDGDYIKEDGNMVTYNVSTPIEITIGGENSNIIKGDNMQAYLQNLIENPDYVIMQVE